MAIEAQTSGKERPTRHFMTRIASMGELAHSVFLKAMDTVFTGDIEIANNLLEIAREIRNEHELLLKELHEFPLMRTVVIELDRIADHGASIAVIAINKALEKSSNVCSSRGLR